MARPRTTTPTKPDDARAHRSIDALRVAFLEMVERKPLDQISIKEITDAAGLSYPTFFRRFASKEDLLESIATGEVENLLALGSRAMGRDEPSEAAIRDMCSYVQQHRKLWATLLNGGAKAAMREEFMRISREIAATRPRTNPWLPLELAVAFVASGTFEILAWWLRQPEDYPLENVVNLHMALIIDSAGRRRPSVLD